MNNKPLFLHHVIMHGIPNFESKGGRCPHACPSLAPADVPQPHAAWLGLLSMGNIFHSFLGNLNFPFPLGNCSLLLGGVLPFPTETPLGGASPGPTLGTNPSCRVTSLF